VHGKLLDVNSVKYLHKAKNAATRLTMFINSLLNFSNLGLNSKPVLCNCRQLLDNVIADLQSIITSSNTLIEVGYMPELNLYETEIRQLFRNLILNAIRFHNKDSRLLIKINSEKTGVEYRFSVSDNGAEIDPYLFDKIVDIFHFLQNDEEFEGSGLGLTYCKKIVGLHNGKIWVKSNTDNGSTFYFTVPDLTL
jgi:light-regulated signal transduction histidine kinase (bacteriophytochrome)